MWLAALAILACAVELGGRQVVRQSLLQNLAGAAPPSAAALIATAVAAALLGAAWLRLRRALTMNRAVALALCALFVAGLAAQQRLGARLQSDGFFYFAFLRSIVYDRDVNLANDYGLIGIGGEAIMTPTSTGYAHTAWSIGPRSPGRRSSPSAMPARAYLSARGRAGGRRRDVLPVPAGRLHRQPVLRPARLSGSAIASRRGSSTTGSRPRHGRAGGADPSWCGTS